MSLTFNDKDCQVLNFTDITTYKKLKREEEKSRLLSVLNYSIHHEIIGPLKANIDVAENLRRHQESLKCKEMAKMVVISSKLILFHANDLLDQKFLQNGLFTPVFTQDSPSEAIREIVEMMKATLSHSIKGDCSKCF